MKLNNSPFPLSFSLVILLLVSALPLLLIEALLDVRRRRVGGLEEVLLRSDRLEISWTLSSSSEEEEAAFGARFIFVYGLTRSNYLDSYGTVLVASELTAFFC